ncbi:MAG TPA: TIGR03621 family F420-dependent LLM class oxidoreductase [Mycobacteriales bacterium]|jgi:probable F420-dependent oxidoreductase|nr:TIGR03621 family F420-dependent LLM class oxidoreductase [Mycobacteriales bacterium]
MRPFRFLAPIGDGLPDARALVAEARRAEEIGIDVLIRSDHLLEQYAPLPVLATVAAATERIRVGTFVLNVDLRHPAVLAQELASLDVLSGGRLEIGMGAGWNEPEYDAVGIPYDRLPTRVQRLTEAVAVLKGCFADGPFTLAGEHFRITGHDGYPKPVQRPHPPLFLGGGGRRSLTLAAREADIIGLAPRPGDPRSMTAAATEEKIGWVREAAGDRFDALEFNAYPSGGPVVVTNDARSAGAERAQRLGLTVEELLESPHVFIGSVDGLAEKCRELRERFGITSIMLDDPEAAAAVIEKLR